MGGNGWFDICFYFMNESQTRFHLLPQKGLKIKEPNQSPKNISSYYNFVFLKSISTYLHTQRGGPSDIKAYLFICPCGQQTVRFEEASFQ